MALREQIKDAMKATKASVDYSKGTPKEHCSICEHYEDGTCEKVQGEIDPKYWCELFEKEEGESEIELNLPLLIRLLEFAREDAKDDLILHKIAEKASYLNLDKDCLTMEDYEELIRD